MAVGKNNRISKGNKCGKKKAADPFAKKDWYDIKAPSVFSVRNVGKTLVTRTQDTKTASEGLKCRVFEVSLPFSLVRNLNILFQQNIQKMDVCPLNKPD